MAKFEVPVRKYSGGNRETVISVRLPSKLVVQLKKIMKAKGYSQTDLIELVLDQYCQYEDQKSSGGG